MFAITSQGAKCADFVRKEYKQSSTPNWFFIEGGGFMPWLRKAITSSGAGK
ncbi:hypothetical protein HZF02_20770 [Pseudomonas yamanorum]|nr:hypothetical protein HZF02_20770 [Pseudomonas yamanorum]